MNFFSSKAETLEKLSRFPLKTANILPIHYFPLSEWKDDPFGCLDGIFVLPEDELFIVRSSSRSEDKPNESNAGAFLTLPNISKAELKNAVNEVFSSYGREESNDLVMIQPMLRGILSSGVAFTNDLETGAPYRIISWTVGQKTDGITKGDKGGKTVFCHRSAELNEPDDIQGISKLVDELQYHFGNQPLDIEFAFSNLLDVRKLWLLQARPLITQQKSILLSEHVEKVNRIEKYLVESMRPNDLLKGETTAFGVMPDWNPAEIIGLRPRPLAKSLYRDLITDNICAYQRNNYGYRNLRGFPLMVELEGLPYIDIRVSFNSFIPQEIEDPLAEKLVNFYMDKLTEKPFLHDKIEFDIVYSCYTLDLEERLNELSRNNFSCSEIDSIKSSLLSLTNKILNPDDGLMLSDSKRIITLMDRRQSVMNSNMTLIQKIYWLIEDGKRYGTLPFAGLARAGFIAVQLLNSLAAKGILSSEDIQNFLSSIRTVSSQMSEDLRLLKLPKFLEIYGHLRPGTYDILSPRYDENPKLYFDHKGSFEKPKDNLLFRLSIDQMKAVDCCLKECGLAMNAIEFFSFIEDAILLRESSKFEFTKNLSDTLSLIGELGCQYGLSLNEISFANIEDIKQLYASSNDGSSELKQSINRGKKGFANSNQIFLPPLITKPSDVWQFCSPEITPNYITQKIVTGHVAGVNDTEMLRGAIVCIPSADPGYDWLFSHSIGGLVTAWGGINSHMAIRAGEMGIPAMIGAGDKIFHEFEVAQYVRMDCGSKGYEVIR